MGKIYLLQRKWLEVLQGGDCVVRQVELLDLGQDANLFGRERLDLGDTLAEQVKLVFLEFGVSFEARDRRG